MSETTKPQDAVTVDVAPQEAQAVSHDGKTLTTVKEGLAYILIPANVPTSLDPKSAKNGLTESQSVFYNPIQQFNRDLSVLAIKAFGEDLMAVKRARAEIKAERKQKEHEKRGVKRKAGEALSTPSRPGKVQVLAGAGDGQLGGNGVAELSNGNMQTSEDQPPAKTHASQEDINASTGALEQPVPEATEPPNEGAGSVVIAPEAEGELKVDGEKSALGPGWKMRFRILDALSATGLRALRYAQEIPFATSITANDLSAQATASIQLNVRHNRLQDKIKAVTGNALTHMYNFVSQSTEGAAKHEGRYDVIDLDPYGTAVPFLDAAVQALNDGGLLCVTCTDAGVWASCGYPEKAYSLYGGTPIKGLHSHEGGLRLILHAIATSAARYGMSIEPLLSLSIDFYARVFVRLYRSPAEVKLLAAKTMLVYSCDGGCGAWQTQFIARNHSTTGKNGETIFTKHSLAQGPPCGPFCEHCGYKLHLSGPMYGGPLHNPAFLETILGYLPSLDKSTYATTSRIEGMISTALEETLIDDDTTSQVAQSTNKESVKRSVPRMDPSQVDAHPFFFIPSALAKVLHCRAPSEPAIRGALRHAGYRATRSHAKPGTIRTDAPWTFVWEVMREWVRQKAPIKEDAIRKGTAGWGIMHRETGHGSTGNGKSDPISVEKTAETEQTTVGHDVGVEITEKPRGKPGQEEVKDDDAAESGAAGRRKIVFDEKLGREAGGGRRLVRYQFNPRANWGPMNRAKGGHGGGGGESGDGAKRASAVGLGGGE